jgi:FtsP/CotA-like multicopper oxidase with cupredoxin domain
MQIRWTKRTRRTTAAVIALALVGAIGWYWSTTLLPSTYSVMSMGYADLGGGLPPMGTMPDMPDMPGPVSVADLTGPPTGAPDVSITLVARKEPFTLPTGQRIDGYTFNHQSPGPVIRAAQGDVLQVTLVNESVRQGVTLHWHGVDVPNADDGVAGVTQDAVPVGGRFTYRFRLNDAGTYWYHSHQDSHVEVPGGLYGVLIVAPKSAAMTPEVVAALHTYGKLRTINGHFGLQRIDAAPGSTMRVRVINTDSLALTLAVTGSTYRLIAIDGHDINKPTDIDHKLVLLAAGGRADVVLTVPSDETAVRVDLGGGAALAIGPPDATPAPAIGAGAVVGTLDLLSYGSPAPIGFDPTHPNRRFEYRIGRRFGVVDGMPGDYWAINGHLYPDVPMFEVNEGDVVIMTISNTSGINHPMHLHGHHAVVLSRDGVAASGSPWWTDSLNVDASTYVIAFVADNPGIWMDHCHNLAHAVAGLTSHLAYLGVTEPYQIGGPAGNQPE